MALTAAMEALSVPYCYISSYFIAAATYIRLIDTLAIISVAGWILTTGLMLLRMRSNRLSYRGMVGTAIS